MERSAQPDLGFWTWFRWCVVLGVVLPSGALCFLVLPEGVGPAPRCIPPALERAWVDWKKASWRRLNPDRKLFFLWKE